MRPLTYKGFILNNGAIWKTTERLRQDPARASLVQIGYKYLSENPDRNMHYRQKKTWIHPLLRVILDLAGHSYLGWILCVLALLADVVYCFHCAVTYDDYFYAVVQFVMSVINLFLYAIMNFGEAKAHSRVVDYSDLENANNSHYMSESTFLMLKGLEAIGKSCDSENSHTSVKAIRKRLVNRTMLEVVSVHFLLSIPWYAGVAYSVMIHLERNEAWLAILSAFIIYSKLTITLSGTQAAFFIRLNQRLCELEIRRVQLEVRTADMRNAQFLPVRVKRLLIENHSITNREHFFYGLWGPVIFFHLVLLGIGIIQAQKGDDHCIPIWVFLCELQPLLSLIVMTHGFARLNLFMERDVEQDLTELALSMSYLKGKKGAATNDDVNIENIIQQLRLLERLDSRPCVLNFDFVPTMESSRSLISFVFTAIGVLGPYIAVALSGNLSYNYMCLD
ncbi:hypothetical protein TrST_g5867 [Triparma strigata]|nr:hypothetical protein TrST_g5867 [Triparma strigata]